MSGTTTTLSSSVLPSSSTLTTAKAPVVVCRRQSLSDEFSLQALAASEDRLHRVDAARAVVESMGPPRPKVPTTTVTGTNDDEDDTIDNDQDLSKKKWNEHRRASLNCNVEMAIAMVNEHPELDEGYGSNPFGCRRDSVTGCKGSTKIRRANLKKPSTETDSYE